MASRWSYTLIAAVSVLWAVLVYGASDLRATSSQDAVPQPPLVPATGEYVGAARCGVCHSDVHATWTAGRHSKMIQTASPATVVGDFSRGALTLKSRPYRVDARDGAFYITESELEGKSREHRVLFTLGSRRIQHYLTRLENGEIVVLPPTWDVERKQWFHNAEIVQPADDQKAIVQQWNRKCVGCHVSGQQNHYDPHTNAYRTEWTDFGTSCERCHGPGARHAAGNWTDAQSARATIIRPTRLDPKTGSMVCAQCHSARTAIDGPYKPGADYFDFFIPALEYAQEQRPNASRDPVYWADGRPRRFSNDAFGLWQSACFLRGGATCTTCHTDPHLPNVDRNPQLAGEASNALCTSCHQDIAARRAEHTRHLPTSRGSQCIECHMPKTVVSIKASMRDHTISVPAPENTVKFDIPNACTECHRDKPASWAAAVMKSWWPEGRRQRLITQAEVFTNARAGRATAVDELIAIADDPSYPPLVRANAVGYLGRFEQPAASSAVMRAARSDEPVIRLAAIAALRGPAGADANTRATILSGLSDPRRAVRVAAALTVAERNGRDLDVAHFARFRTAAQEVVSWTQQHKDEPDLQRVQGVVQLLAGEINAAAEALAMSLSHDPDATQTRFLLGLARLQQGRAGEARELWRGIPRGDRYYESAQRQLKALESASAGPR